MRAVLLTAFFLSFSVSAAIAQDNPLKDSIKFYDGHEFDVIGKYHSEKNYGRFPAKFENTLRDKVWNLGQNSAGVGIRFRTDASTIIVRWTVMNDANLRHMPATGVKGVDLYAHNGKDWQYVRTGFPVGKSSEATLLEKADGTTREYLLNLPLYDGVENLEIGVNASATITRASEKFLLDHKPVVYYGTSIAQGGCASRPGLAFTSILSRSLNVPFINLGFSGNGTIESSVGEAMAEIDAALYVIDCNPNTAVDLIYDRTIALVHQLRKARPDAPILLVEGFLYDIAYLDATVHETVLKKQKELKRAFDALRKTGVTKLHYRSGEGLIGDDHEGTVDGVHPNDLGMMRIAESLEPVIRKLL
ncbi:MAG TPA: SGNH/GDSL hydrolase family protein [Chryseosolibacter sp.]|nr:SGNH/GDSL hydrolase family protein [Chryseosolibacter sp.]